MNHRVFSAAAALLLLINVCHSQTTIETADLDSALNYLGMTRADFISDRAWVEDDTFLLPEIKQALESPLEAYRICKEFSSAAPVSVLDAGRIYQMAETVSAACPETVRRDIDARLAAARPTVMDPFEPMLSAFALAEGYRAQAFSGLSKPQKQAFLLAVPMWFEDEDSAADDSLKGMLHRAFHQPVDTTQNATVDSLLTLLALINREALSASSYAFARGLAMTTAAWMQTKSPFQTAVVSGVEGLVLASRETPYGTFVLSGSGPNTYTGTFALIIDLGGDDRYVSRVGAAIGEFGSPISAVMDMGGNDQYLFSSPVNAGCGILGLGALIDMGGNDLYRSGMLSQGAAFAGCGLLFDGGGDDLYRGGSFAQGAAVCGIAVLSDAAGRDVYDLSLYGQGFASTFGAAALVDGSGNDIYRAGGLETHSPLRPEDFRSFAQGFAIGARPRSGGGIAVLHDLDGNDFYNAEIYAQGVGYWYSMGGLIDDGGNDVYNATQYSQGAGIHLAVGVLEDVKGDDRYGSRFGPGQGAAHDLSVGVFIEGSGDDQYIISGGQGMAITNSAALFVDRFGNDTYSTTETDIGQGGSREARDFGNLSVFVDSEGNDSYSATDETDSLAWLHGVFGVGYDAPRDSIKPREAEVQVELVPSDTLKSVEELFKQAAEWEVTDNRERVKRARLALTAKGLEAVRWVGENKLNTQDALERRAIVELFKAFPDSAASDLFRALNADHRYGRRNAVSIFGEMKYRPALSPLLSKLDDPAYEKLRPSILSASGEIGDPSAVSVVLNYMTSTVERERIAAAVSLGKLSDSRGYEAMVNALADEKYTVRSAAIIAVGRQSASVLPVLQKVIAESAPADLPVKLRAVEQLARVWTSNDDLRKNLSKLQPIVRSHLEYPNPRVQAAALAVAEIVYEDRELQKLVQNLKTLGDPVLSARIRRLETKLR